VFGGSCGMAVAAVGNFQRGARLGQHLHARGTPKWLATVHCKCVRASGLRAGKNALRNFDATSAGERVPGERLNRRGQHALRQSPQRVSRTGRRRGFPRVFTMILNLFPRKQMRHPSPVFRTLAAGRDGSRTPVRLQPGPGPLDPGNEGTRDAATRHRRGRALAHRQGHPRVDRECLLTTHRCLQPPADRRYHLLAQRQGG